MGSKGRGPGTLTLLILALTLSVTVCLRHAACQSQSASPELLHSKWQAVLEAIQASDLRSVTDLVPQLDKMRAELGYDSLEDYSFSLIRFGEKRLKAGKKDEAAFFARKAIELSPNSARILFGSLHLVQASGAVVSQYSSLFAQFIAGVKAVTRSREVQLHTLKSVIYPALWAVTLGLYLSLLLCFLHSMHLPLGMLAKVLPAGVRGFLSAPLLLAAMVLPCLAGPLWCLFAWSVLLYICFKPYRWLGLYAGAVIGLWAALIPLRENLVARLLDPGIQTLLKISSGQFSPTDRVSLEVLVKARPDDAAALFALGQVLRREGNYEKAHLTFTNALKRFRDNEPWVQAQMGLIEFMRGHAQEADKYFSDAESQGLNTLEFYFNYSKIKFDLTDTIKSREYFELAYKKHASITKELKEREELLGVRDRNSLAEMSMPLSVLLKSLFVGIPGAQDRHDAMANKLMPGADPFVMAGVCIVLVVGFFLVGEVRGKLRRQLFYSRYEPGLAVRWFTQLLPGGAWLRVGHPSWGAMILSTVIFLCMPLIPWPAESAALMSYMPQFTPIYAGMVGLVALVICYIGNQMLGEEEEKESSMESGVISHENISNILRNISQRRRQGILEVSYADQQEHIVFVQGRVVEAFSTNMFAIGELVLCLRRAGLIGEQENFDASTYGELLAELNQVGRSVVMDKPFLCRVNKHRILDHLYNLQMDRSAYYTFKVQMVEYDRDFAASISVGQVLLDLVALEGEHGQFVKDFPDHATIRSTTTAGTVELTEEERVVVEIASQDISCGKLRRKALLSRFHFESTLMSLHERGILSVSVTSPAHADTGTVPAALDTNAFLSALEVSIDSTFDQERNDSLREVARSSADPLEVSFGAADETQPLIEAAEHSAAPRWYVVQNTRLLQVNWMSPLLALVVLLTAISAPFLFWNDLLMSFTD